MSKQAKSCSSKKCDSASVAAYKNLKQNGKGDKPRPFAKIKYNNNYDSINWKKK
jgi:hypothetical protein